MNNRLHNISNPNQGKYKKILCVCSAGLLRSPTLALVLANEGHNTRAVGSSQEYALIPLDKVMIEWADEIVFVSKSNYLDAQYDYPYLADMQNIIVLDIPDKYEYRNPELMEICLDQYNQSKA